MLLRYPDLLSADEVQQAQALLSKAPWIAAHCFSRLPYPNGYSPPRLNRYGGDSNYYGNHIDGAVRYLSDPETYDGGELCIADTYGELSIKLPAGHIAIADSIRPSSLL
jgi:PKHD-type hydroxylase